MFNQSELETLAASVAGADARALISRELSRLATLASHEKLMWDTYCGRYGLKPSDRNKVFFIGKNKYRAVGINIRSAKTPINCVRVCDGKTFKVPSQFCVC